MIFAFWDGTGWTSGVNAAIVTSLGVIVVATATLAGVRWQIKSRKRVAEQQLAHDTRQRHLDRVTEREGMLVADRMEALRRFTRAVDEINRAIAGLLAKNRPKELAVEGAPLAEWAARWDKLNAEVDTAFRGIDEEFTFSDEMNEFGVLTYRAVEACSGPVAQFLGKLQFQAATVLHGEEATNDVEAAAKALEESRRALVDPWRAFQKAALAEAMRVAE
jgi:hypothetical protein